MKLAKSLLVAVLSITLSNILFTAVLTQSVSAQTQDLNIALQRGFRTGYSDGYMAGYRDTMRHLYEPRVFYHRVMRFIRTFEMQKKKVFHLNAGYVRALFKSMFLLGVVGRERVHYWKLFGWSLFRRPQLFSMAITFSIYGYHFRKVFEHY